MRFWSFSEPGHNHENQDVIWAQPHPNDGDAIICILADGQGGQPGGKEAAQTAVETVWREAAARPMVNLLVGIAWCEIIALADDAVETNERAGFTTVIAACVYRDNVFGASVGDSAALLVRSQDCISLTQRQRKNPPVGSCAAIPTPFEGEIGAGDKLLLMSDGVWRYVGEDVLAATVRRENGEALFTALRFLQTQQNRGVLPDDFSVILVGEMS